MAYWLFKSEPASWSWAQQQACGERGQAWDGVRNYQARNFMRAMQVGERGFFYHSVEHKAVVGVVEVARAARPDPTAEGGPWDCVDLRALADLPIPVPLAAIKAEPACRGMALVTNARLSVQPVTAAEFEAVCRLGGLDPTSL